MAASAFMRLLTQVFSDKNSHFGERIVALRRLPRHQSYAYAIISTKTAACARKLAETEIR